MTGHPSRRERLAGRVGALSVIPASAIVTGMADANPPDDLDESTAQERTAWAQRRRMPSELVHKTALRWPGEVSAMIDITEVTLKRLRAAGDHPRLYAIGRALFTTHGDLLTWLEAHELPAGQTLRPAVILRGTKLPPPSARGRPRK